MDRHQTNPNRAVVFAPFFSLGLSANRPRMVATALAELMPVHVVTCDFDHSLKARRAEVQCDPYEKIIYLKTNPYPSNVSPKRLLSHLLFAFRAAKYFRETRHRYTVVYVTAPLNVLALLVLSLAGSKARVLDIIDIWPDVLPFSRFAKRILAPVLAVWKWFLKSGIRKCDLVMAVSDEFLREASVYATTRTRLRRFYIGCRQLQPSVSKEAIFTIAYIGNIGNLYDFETLVEVLSEEQFRTCIQLFVIGKGDRQDWLFRELDRHHIRYRFFGVVYNDTQLAEILGRCHVGFNGYRNTTAAFSYKAVTYLAAGLPILNSMTGDLKRVVEQYDIGANYESGNREQMRECLLRLQEDGSYRAAAANSTRFFESQLEASRVLAEIRTFLHEGLHKVMQCRT